jgi:hypothetical protein
MIECAKTVASISPADSRQDQIVNDFADSAMTNVNCEVTAPQSFRLSCQRPTMFLASHRLPEKDLRGGGTRGCHLCLLV